MFPLRFAVMAGALLIACAPSPCQISLVRTTACGPGSFPGTACAIPPTANGNLIVIGWQTGSKADLSTAIASITDNVGNVYAQAGGARAVDGAVGNTAEIWYSKNSLPGATAVFITPNIPATNSAAVIWELAGADPSAPLGQTASLNSQAASANPVGAGIVSSFPSAAVIALAAVAGDVTGMANGNSFISDSALKGNGWAHLITSAAGNYTPQWQQLPSATYAAATASFNAAVSGPVSSACDLNQDGGVDMFDVQLSVAMARGLIPCTADVLGENVCNILVVQDVVNAALGGNCTPGVLPHSVALSWTPSATPNVVGYNIFRGTSPGGPYTQISASPVSGPGFFDPAVEPGQTYYYVATSLDSNGVQSAFSNESQATVPTP